MALNLRRAVRAVVMDDADRVLLVRFELPDSALWAMPGGGVDDGESPEMAIRRELCEEVGLRDVELGPVIWKRTHVFPSHLASMASARRSSWFVLDWPTVHRRFQQMSCEPRASAARDGGRWPSSEPLDRSGSLRAGSPTSSRRWSPRGHPTA